MGCVSSTPSPELDANEQHELASLRQFQSTASQEYNDSWTLLELNDVDKKVSKKDITAFWETIGSAFYGVLFVPFIFAILQEAVSEGVAISPFGSEVYVSRGSWIAAFVFLATVSIYTMGVFNMALSAYMYSILLFSIVLLVLLQQARP